MLASQKSIENMFDIEQPNIEDLNVAYTLMDRYNTKLKEKRKEYEKAKELMF